MKKLIFLILVISTLSLNKLNAQCIGTYTWTGNMAVPGGLPGTTKVTFTVINPYGYQPYFVNGTIHITLGSWPGAPYVLGDFPIQYEGYLSDGNLLCVAYFDSGNCEGIFFYIHASAACYSDSPNATFLEFTSCQ